jgi:hypothetical protein
MSPMTDARPNPDWRPLALSLALLAAAYAVLYRFIPFADRAYLLYPFGAWALYSGARLTTRVALPLTIGVFAATDLLLYVGNAVPPNYLFYLLLGLYVLIGRGLLARSQAAWRIVAGSVGGYALFFLASNFAAWLEVALPEYAPHTLDTLLLAYRRGLEFLRMQPGQLIGDLVLSFGLFGAHAALAKAYFPAERVVPQEAAV